MNYQEICKYIETMYENLNGFINNNIPSTLILSNEKTSPDVLGGNLFSIVIVYPENIMNFNLCKDDNDIKFICTEVLVHELYHCSHKMSPILKQSTYFNETYTKLIESCVQKETMETMLDILQNKRFGLQKPNTNLFDHFYFIEHNFRSYMQYEHIDLSTFIINTLKYYTFDMFPYISMMNNCETMLFNISINKHEKEYRINIDSINEDFIDLQLDLFNLYKKSPMFHIINHEYMISNNLSKAYLALETE